MPGQPEKIRVNGYLYVRADLNPELDVEYYAKTKAGKAFCQYIDDRWDEQEIWSQLRKDLQLSPAEVKKLEGLVAKFGEDPVHVKQDITNALRSYLKASR